MFAPILKPIKAIGKIHSKIEQGIVVISLGSITFLSLLQIVLRIFFDSSLVWADGLIRLLLLWLCMGGALLASQHDRHIRIDVILRLLPARFGRYVCSGMALLTAVVSGVVAWAAFRFVAMEREFLSTVLQDLPAWPFQTIIPYAFTIIALRYLAHAFTLSGCEGEA